MLRVLHANVDRLANRGLFYIVDVFLLFGITENIYANYVIVCLSTVFPLIVFFSLLNNLFLKVDN